jgi:hypothetical protein
MQEVWLDLLLILALLFGELLRRKLKVFCQQDLSLALGG